MCLVLVISLPRHGCSNFNNYVRGNDVFIVKVLNTSFQVPDQL